MEKIDFLEPDYFYHIYNRGNNKENLFTEETNYFHFLKLLTIHISEIADVYSYCLLKNHFHLVIKIKSKECLNEKRIDKLHQPFSNLFNAYTKAYNKMYNREGSLFKVRFKRVRITSIDYLINVILYIHLNPIKHKFAENFEVYAYSSYQSLLSTKPTQLKRKEVLELFGDLDHFIYVHKQALLEGHYEEFD